MKRLIAYVTISLAAAIGTTACAHQQLTKAHAAETAASVAVVVGLVILAANSQCSDCSLDVSGPHAALPPR